MTVSDEAKLLGWFLDQNKLPVSSLPYTGPERRRWPRVPAGVPAAQVRQLEAGPLPKKWNVVQPSIRKSYLWSLAAVAAFVFVVAIFLQLFVR